MNQYNPLQDMTDEQLQYLYRETEVGSLLWSNVSSMLAARQMSLQDSIQREKNLRPGGLESLTPSHI